MAAGLTSVTFDLVDSSGTYNRTTLLVDTGHTHTVESSVSVSDADQYLHGTGGPDPQIYGFVAVSPSGFTLDWSGRYKVAAGLTSVVADVVNSAGVHTWVTLPVTSGGPSLPYVLTPPPRPPVGSGIENKPPFFIIGVYMVPEDDPSVQCPTASTVPANSPYLLSSDSHCSMLRWKTRGVNTVVKVPLNGHSTSAWSDSAHRQGLSMIRRVLDVTSDISDASLLAWDPFDDEPDLDSKWSQNAYDENGQLIHQAFTTQQEITLYTSLKSHPGAKPVWLNFSGGDILWPFSFSARAPWRPEFTQWASRATDWVGSDFYGITDWADTAYVDASLTVAPGPMRWTDALAVDALRTYSEGLQDFTADQVERVKQKGKTQLAFVASANEGVRGPGMAEFVDARAWLAQNPNDSNAQAALAAAVARSKKRLSDYPVATGINPSALDDPNQQLHPTGLLATLFQATRDEFRAEIWRTILHGANGVIYFPELVGKTFAWDNTPAELEAEMRVQNGIMSRMSQVLIADGVQMTTVPAPFEAAARYVGSDTYVLVLNGSHTAQTLEGLTFGPYEVKFFKNGAAYTP